MPNKIIPLTSDKCYICFEFTNDRSPCKCKSYLHKKPCLEKLIENHINQNSITSIKCTICKTPYSKEIIHEIANKFISNNISGFRKFIFTWIYEPERPLYKYLNYLIKIFITILLFFMIYGGGIFLNYSFNNFNNTNITTYYKFGPHNFIYGFGVFTIFAIFIGCLKKCCFNDNALCL